MKQLAGRVALITGAAGGIGQALAGRLAGAGMALALVDCDGAGLTATAADLPGDVSCHPCDLRDFDALPGLIQAVTQAHGGLDLLINNAGLTVHGRFADHDRADIDKVMDVDLRAVLHLTHAALPALRVSGDAHVVLVSSMAGMVGFPTQAVYSAAKWGLRGFGHALRIELAGEGIGVSTVLPGTIATGFLSRAGTSEGELTRSLSALMLRFGTPPDAVARAVLRAVRRDRREVRVGWDCHLAAAVGWALPPALPYALRLGYRRALTGRRS